VTAVAFILWYSTVAALGAGRVGLLTGIAPVSAAVTGIMMGSQAPRPLVWLGMLVVISALIAGLWSPTTLAAPKVITQINSHAGQGG